MSNSPHDNLTNQHLINQLDGFYAVSDLTSRCFLLNQTAATWLGFGTPEQGLGRRYEDIQAPVVESVDFFYALDALVIKKKTRIFCLGYYGYHNGYKMIQGVKSPFFNEHQEVIGVGCQMHDVSHLNVINKDHLIFKPDYINFSDNTAKQFCYLFIENQENDLLSERETECLFFLLRKKTAKETADILSLSSRTVEDYIERIRIKLNCRSKAELIGKATAKNYGNQLPLKYLKELWTK